MDGGRTHAWFVGALLLPVLSKAGPLLPGSPAVALNGDGPLLINRKRFEGHVSLFENPPRPEQGDHRAITAGGPKRLRRDARAPAYTVCMADALKPSVLRRAENTELSLGSLEAIAAIRARLDVLEVAAMLSAREKGATMEDIAEALGLTPQAIYYRFRKMRDGHGERAT